MQISFILQNVHFALNIFASFVFFAVFWLHLDAWLGRKRSSETIKLSGLLFLSVSFLLHALVLEQTSTHSIFPAESLNMFSLIFRLIVYTALIITQIADPIQPKPETKPMYPSSAGIASFGKGTPLLLVGNIFQPILCLGVAALFFRRATTGLENHL